MFGLNKFTSGHFVSHPCFKGFCSRTCYISQWCKYSYFS